MSVWGIATVKDEVDVVEGVLQHMADEVDHLLVLDNGSTDGTREILADLESRLPLTVVNDPEVGYYQSKRMSALAERAASMGAVWAVPFDADEIWVAPGGRIREVLAGLDGCDIAVADLINHFCTSVDTDDPDPFRAMVWRQAEPARLPKVAFRWRPGAVIEQGNHGVTLPGGVVRKTVLQVRHFPYRSAAQMVRKAVNGAAAYAATDLPADQGAHWRAYGEIVARHGPGALEKVWEEHFWYLSPTDSGLIRDPAPYRRWQTGEGVEADV